jgi:hypothetical protein
MLQVFVKGKLIFMLKLFEHAYNDILNKRPLSNLNEIIAELQINCNSYEATWHALGFIHCKLGSFPKGTLRLHIWPTNERHSQEQVDKVHDHIFSLTSFVICGEITNETFVDKSVLKKAAEKLCYEVKYLLSGANLCATGNYYRETVECVQTIGKGGNYNVLAGVLHQSSVRNGVLVATLVATFEHNDSNPRMLGPINGFLCYTEKNYLRQKKMGLLII